MSTRSKNVRQDVAFRVVSCFTDPPVRRVFRWECRATPREILRQTNTTFSSLDYSDAIYF